MTDPKKPSEPVAALPPPDAPTGAPHEAQLLPSPSQDDDDDDDFTHDGWVPVRRRRQLVVR